jgi:hypothetical protein
MRIQIKNLPTISTPEPEKQNHMGVVVAGI